MLFSQGGGTGQFSSTVLNVLAAHRIAHPNDKEPPILDYVVTGSWSSKALKEAQRLCEMGPTHCAKPRAAATTKASKWTTLPRREEYDFNKDAAMVYYCENETINGVQFPADTSSPHAFPFDLVPPNAFLVGDHSSSFLSRPIPHIEKHAIIYAGAQKNLGPAGVTVLIVRKDLLVDTDESARLGAIPVPIQNEYKILADNGSLYNTPPTFTIYVCALVLEQLVANGGLAAMGEKNTKKSGRLYETLEAAEGKGQVRVLVKEKDARSQMNITFEILGDQEKAWLAGAEEREMRQLKGHRSVGGIRASLYNAVELESVEKLCEYIRTFH